MGSAGTKECVVLVHGMFRGGWDMACMARVLKAHGYDTLQPSLPATFGRIESCVSKLGKFIGGITDKYQKVHFVGHSMGGLITRAYLAVNVIKNLGRCVLIGTPNGGVDLADKIASIPILLKNLNMLPVLLPPGCGIGKPMNNPPPEIGIMGGTSNRGIFLGCLFGKNSDGRVSIDSVPLNSAKETVWRPFNHHKIHHDPESLEMVISFLATGSFSAQPKS